MGFLACPSVYLYLCSSPLNLQDKKRIMLITEMVLREITLRLMVNLGLFNFSAAIWNLGEVL